MTTTLIDATTGPVSLLKCPSWCDRDHGAPSPGAAYVAHRHLVAESVGQGTTIIEVLVIWREHLGGSSSPAPRVMVCTHDEDGSAEVEMTRHDAGRLSFAIAIADGCDRWMASALGVAAELLGYGNEEG